MKIEMQKAQSYTEEQETILEEGPVYEAVVTGFGETENKWGKRLVWRFSVTDPETDEQVEAAAFTSHSTFEGNAQKGPSNLAKYAKALNGGEMPLDADGDFESDLLIGKRGRVVTSTYTRANGIVKNIVTNVLAPKAAKIAV